MITCKSEQRTGIAPYGAIEPGMIFESPLGGYYVRMHPKGAVALSTGLRTEFLPEVLVRVVVLQEVNGGKQEW